jgi:hypothetical protein
MMFFVNKWQAEETARMFTHRVPQSAAAIQPQQSMLNAEVCSGLSFAPVEP